MPKRAKDSWREFEKFYDSHRFFIPLLFIGTVLMVFGINYLGPVTILNRFELTGPITISKSENVLALTLLPGWIFRVDVVTTKPVTIELVDLYGNIINSTTGTTLFSKISYLDYYILRLKGDNFALIGLTYYKSGIAPYAVEYSLFGGGLLLFLLTLTYFFIRPLKFKLKLYFKSVIDAFFYPMIMFLSVIVFWVFRNSLMWILPKDFASVGIHALMVLIIISVVSILSIKFKGNRINGLIINYLLAYLFLYIVSLLTYAGVMIGFSTFLLNLVILGFLLFLYMKSKNNVAVICFLFAWIISLMLSLAVYVVGVPVNYDNVLAIPNTGGTWVLFFIVEAFMIATTYFMIKGYCSKSIAESLENGLFAGMLFQGILQSVIMTNVML